MRAFRREVADQLTERLRADEAAERTRMSPADQRQYGRQLINRRLERYAKEQLERGVEPLSYEDEIALAQAIHDALFGLGILQRLLDDESIENIDANGCADVWITRSDGSKERAPGHRRQRRRAGRDAAHDRGPASASPSAGSTTARRRSTCSCPTAAGCSR